MNSSNLLKASGIRQLPQGWGFVSGRMQEWLEEVDCVIGMDTSAILEPIVMGLPTVIVGRESELTMNPLGWMKDNNLPQPVFGIDEFKTEARNCFQLNDKEKKVLKDINKLDEERLKTQKDIVKER